MNIKIRRNALPRKLALLALSLVLLLSFQAPTIANGTGKINFHGLLVDENGQRVDGTVNATFTILEVDNGSKVAIWQESQTINVRRGVFSTALGTNGQGLKTRNLTGEAKHVFSDASKDYEVRISIGTKTFPDIPFRRTARSIDSAYLDGKPGSYYLDLANLTGALQSDKVTVSGGLTLTVFSQQTNATLTSYESRLKTLETALNSPTGLVNQVNSNTTALTNLQTQVTADIQNLETQVNHPSSGLLARMLEAEKGVAENLVGLKKIEIKHDALSGIVNHPSTGLLSLSSSLSNLTGRVSAVEAQVSNAEDSVSFQYTGVISNSTHGALLNWSFLEPQSHSNFEIENFGGGQAAILVKKPGTYLLTLSLHMFRQVNNCSAYVLEKNSAVDPNKALSSLHAGSTGSHSVTRVIKFNTPTSIKVAMDSGLVSNTPKSNILTLVRIH